MLDLRFIRENPEIIRKAMQDKQLVESIHKLDELLVLDRDFKVLRGELEQKQAKRNTKSKTIGQLKHQGKPTEELMSEMGKLSEEVKQLTERSRYLETKQQELLLEIPNIPHESVPYGESEQGNIVVKEWGEKPAFNFETKPHWEIAKSKGWIDFEAGVKTTGSGFPIFKGIGARLLRSLIQYCLNSLIEKGYLEHSGPLLVNAESAIATGQLPDKAGQMYQLVDEDFYLIPTSELILAGIHRNDILAANDLPLKYTAYSPCFRREAGSYGAHVRGLNRVHQFDKVEMVQFTHPEQSYGLLEEMTETSEGLLEQLNLPYRRLLMCSGDMGFTQAKKYDLEVWSAGQERWLEVSSCSNITDFQARRLQTRFREGGKQGKGKPELVHTLNGSAFGMVRIVAAIIENNQTKKGTVVVPEVLKQYIGKDILD